MLAAALHRSVVAPLLAHALYTWTTLRFCKTVPNPDLVGSPKKVILVARSGHTGGVVLPSDCVRATRIEALRSICHKTLRHFMLRLRTVLVYGIHLLCTRRWTEGTDGLQGCGQSRATSGPALPQA